MGLPNPIGTRQVAADIERHRDEAAPLGLADRYTPGDVVFSSEDELRTTLVFFTDLGHETEAGSRKFNIVHLDFIPESGIK